MRTLRISEPCPLFPGRSLSPSLSLSLSLAREKKFLRLDPFAIIAAFHHAKPGPDPREQLARCTKRIIRVKMIPIRIYENGNAQPAKVLNEDTNNVLVIEIVMCATFSILFLPQATQREIMFIECSLFLHYAAFAGYLV